MSAFLALALNFAPSPYAAYEMSIWMLGSLSEKSWDHVLLAAPFIALGLAILATMGRAVDALALGEAQAESLGFSLDRSRVLALLGVGLAVGAATSVVGSVELHRPGRAASGAARSWATSPAAPCCPRPCWARRCCSAPTSARGVIPTNTELRLGVITALIGAPFFFWLVLRLRKVAP